MVTGREQLSVIGKVFVQLSLKPQLSVYLNERCDAIETAKVAITVYARARGRAVHTAHPAGAARAAY